MAKYLVTGSAGFIGFHVARSLLERGEEVVGLDNLNPYYSVKLKEDRNEILKGYPSYIFHPVEMSERDNLYYALDKEKPEVICHLAAQAGVRFSLEHPFVYEQANLLAFLNLIEWCVKNEVENFVFASSSSVYGGNKKIPFSESDRVDQPISLYAATKKANELIGHVYHHLFALPVTGLRFFTVYGPWGRPDMAYYKFSELITEHKPIDVYGHGKMKRDFTFVDDIVSAVVKSLDTPQKYEIYNLGGNKPVELMYFISILEQELGLEAEKNFLAMQPGDVVETYAEIEKAHRDLGFEPTVSIEEGLKRFVEWFTEYHSEKYI
jgi:UDP-glucuronate 4-epimerase